MNQNRFACRMGSCLIVLCMIGFSGCVRSVYPILKDEQVIQDESLEGDWITSDGEIQMDAKAQSHIGERYQPFAALDLDFSEGKTRIPLWGYRVIVSETKNDLQRTALRVRLGKVGQMTLAEFSLAADQWRQPDKPNIVEDQMIRPLYSVAQVEFVTPDHLRVRMIDNEWLKTYLQQHPDELRLLNKDLSMPELVSTTEEIQAFLIKHANDGFWSKGSLDFVRPGDPTTQPDAATQPAGASSQPAR